MNSWWVESLVVTMTKSGLSSRTSFSNRSSFGGISKEFMTGENQIEIHLQWDGANGGDETIRFERVEVQQ